MSLLLRGVVSWALVALALSLPAEAQETSWRVMSGEVRVVCPMTVGGSFDATTTALEGVVAADESGPLRGSIEVDLTTLDTGIELRDTHLRDTYLEVDRGRNFARAVLSGIVLDGADPRTFEGETTFTATFRLHGVERPVAGVAELERTPDGIGVVAHFPVVLSDHAIQAPRYLGVGVSDQVQAEVRFSAVREPE
ncbi:MAG: YceI family protein [Gemmatimonadetes bacterium]|nr:YceI family protein [Gemmatimonadota bacterium]